MPWVALSIVAAAVVLILVFAIRYGGERREVMRQRWREFATSRGLEWHPASGPWYRRQPDSVDGAFEGAWVKLDTFVVSTGKSHVSYTRVVSTLEREPPSKITVSRRHFLTGFGEKLGMKTVRTGDSNFDQRMVVRAHDAEGVRRTVDEEVRARILEMRPSARVRIDGGLAKVTWRGIERDPKALDAAFRIAAAVSRTSTRP